MEKDIESLKKEEKKQKRIHNNSAIVFLVVFLINLFFLVPMMNVLLGSSLHIGALLAIEAIVCLLTSAVPIYLLVKSTGEIFEVSSRIKSLEEKEEYEQLIDNIKAKFEGLSREQQIKLLNFVKEEVSVREIFTDMSNLDDKDIQLLQEYFEEEVLSPVYEYESNCQENSLPVARDYTDGFVRTRNMWKERKNGITAVDYNENGQLQY